MGANFTPTRQPQTPLEPFRYWCQHVLPLVYDDSLSYYELLNKLVDYLNKTMEDVSNMDTDMTNMYTAYDQLHAYVNTYFDSLDVQDKINNKLDEMAEDGSLYAIIRQYTDPIVNEQNQKINVLESRMDAFTTLQDGSTTGDAELQDIRVGYDGTIYRSAGNAVREQVSSLKEDLDDLENVSKANSKKINTFVGFDIFDFPIEYSKGYIDSSDYTTLLPQTFAMEITTGKILINKGDTLDLEFNDTVPVKWARVFVFGENDDKLKFITFSENTSYTFTEDVVYIRISFRGYTLEENALSIKTEKTMKKTFESSLLEIYLKSIERNCTKFMSRQGQFTGKIDNSIDGFKYALTHGYDSVRASACFTSDGYSILSHDDYLYKINGIRRKDGETVSQTDKISNFTKETLFNTFSIYGREFTTLEELIPFCKKYNSGLTIEIKKSMTSDVAERYVNLLLAYGMAEHTFWSMTDTEYSVDVIKSVYEQSNIARIMHLSSSSDIDYYLNNWNTSGKKRVDIFKADMFDPNVWAYARSKNVEIKMGSASNVTDILAWIGKADVIEVASVEYPFYNVLIN